MFAQFKITVIIVSVVLLLLGVMGMLYRMELRKNAALSAENSALLQVNAKIADDVARITQERDLLEAAMKQYADDQQRLIEANQARLKATENQLAKLRGKNDQTKSFMDTPLPGDIVGWLRQRADHPDGSADR